MAGNVREWCWNETPVGHIIRGGAWDDAIYLYADMSQVPSLDRSNKNGFRCVQYIDKEKIPESAFNRIKYSELMDWYSGDRDYSKEKPVPENEFMFLKTQFLYDTSDLKTDIEERINSYEDWTIEKITFNAAYGKERMIAYLFLPRNALPPFQTLIFWPGINTVFEKNLIKSDWKGDIDYLLKSGRAVMYPVYFGTFERNYGPVPKEGHQLTDWVIKVCKDFKRSIDYLETRPDIDTSKLGFYGTSWGGSMGGMIPAIEKRLKVNILIIGGFNGAILPEVHAINYVSRVKIPTLMLNGKYDLRYNLDLNVKPFYKLLETSEEHKRLKIYETDHWILKSEIMKETLNWLDKYFGPAK
jgi:dienelactone hydrolase